MSLVLELPPHVETRLRAEADAQGRDPAAVAADRLLASFAVSDQHNQITALRPFAEYASELAYVEAARQKAPLFGLNPDEMAALAEGVADMEMGRTIALEEYLAEQKAAREARRTKRESAA